MPSCNIYEWPYSPQLLLYIQFVWSHILRREHNGMLRTHKTKEYTEQKQDTLWKHIIKCISNTGLVPPVGMCELLVNKAKGV